MLPPRSAVGGLPETAVIASEDRGGIAGIDPNRMEIAMRCIGRRTEAAPSIHAEQKNKIRFEDFVFIRGINDQIGEVERPPYHELAGIEAVPVLPAIIRAEERALL